MEKTVNLTTAAERHILRTHRGNTKESRAIRIRLFEKHGRKYCGKCDTIKYPTDFSPDGRLLDGRPRSLGGTCSVCRACDNRRKSRARTSMSLFDFTGPERNARYRARMTPAERLAYYARGNAQRRDK